MFLSAPATNIQLGLLFHATVVITAVNIIRKVPAIAP